MARALFAAGISAVLGASALVLAAEDSRPVPVPETSAAPAVDQFRRESTRVSATDKLKTEIDLAKLRLREGTRLRDVSGRFRQSGDSLTFIDGQNREISGLPNLNLERILRMLKTVEEPESITWSVSGTVTEFSGNNYLLISRAVYKAAAPPPAPESLSPPKAGSKP